MAWDLPGGPAAKIPYSQCKGPRSTPCSGNWIPHAATRAWHNQRKQIFKNNKNGLKLLDTSLEILWVLYVHCIFILKNLYLRKLAVIISISAIKECKRSNVGFDYCAYATHLSAVQYSHRTRQVLTNVTFFLHTD